MNRHWNLRKATESCKQKWDAGTTFGVGYSGLMNARISSSVPNWKAWSVSTSMNVFNLCATAEMSVKPRLILKHDEGVPVQLYPSSIAQIEEQPSPFAVLLSSQFSVPSTFPSPHCGPVFILEQIEGRMPMHCQPAATLQFSQPSPGTALPSSHYSTFGSAKLSPQIGRHEEPDSW